MVKTEELKQIKKNELPLFEIDTAYLPALYYVLEGNMDFFVPDASGQKDVNLKQIIISYKQRSRKLRIIKKYIPGIDTSTLSIGDINRFSANMRNYRNKIYRETGEEINNSDLLSLYSKYIKHLSKNEIDGLNEIKEKIGFGYKTGNASTFDSASVEDTLHPKSNSSYEHLEDYANFKKYLVVYYTNKDVLRYATFIDCLNGMPTEEFAWKCSSIMKHGSGIIANQDNPLSQNFPDSFKTLLSDLQKLHTNFLLEQKIQYIEKNEDGIKELRYRFLKYYDNPQSFLIWINKSDSKEFIESVKKFIKKGQGFERNTKKDNPICISNPGINAENFDDWKQKFKEIIGNFDKDK
jgi:hypothetical protein